MYLIKWLVHVHNSFDEVWNYTAVIYSMLTCFTTFVLTYLSPILHVFRLRAGVPRQHRGEIWKFLSEQYLLKQTVPSRPPAIDTPYKELLKQLTSQQHAILIDLGNKLFYYPNLNQLLTVTPKTAIWRHDSQRLYQEHMIMFEYNY